MGVRLQARRRSRAASGAGGASRGGIPTRKFGKTGESLTVIGQAGGRFPLCTFEEAKAITLRAYDLGVNYFDNAHGYWNGRSEEVFGEVLPQFRKDVFITTKSVKRSREDAEARTASLAEADEDGLRGSVADPRGRRDGGSGPDLRPGWSH